MIRKPRDYETAKEYGTSSFRELPADGYICRILMAEEMTDRSGKPMVHIAFDICEGEYKNFFGDLFRQKKQGASDPSAVKWPFEGQMWIPVYDYERPDDTNRKFKGLCTAAVKSDAKIWSGDVFNIDALKNVCIGIVFQKTERETQDGDHTYWRTLPWGCRSVESIENGEYFVPDEKPLPKSDSNSAAPVLPSEMPDSFSMAEEDLPF